MRLMAQGSCENFSYIQNRNITKLYMIRISSQEKFMLNKMLCCKLCLFAIVVNAKTLILMIMLNICTNILNSLKYYVKFCKNNKIKWLFVIYTI